jgi:hypothetical protein
MTVTMSSAPRLITLPSRDEVFGRAARELAARIPVDLPEVEAREWLELELRRRFPTAEVREQDELARPEGGDLVWYATRRQRFFRIDTSVHVPVAPGHAFELYTGRVVEWQVAVALVPIVVTDRIAGSEYRARYRFLGTERAGTFRVVAAEPPRSVTIEAEGSGIRVWYETTFAAIPGGTTVTVRGDYELPDSMLARVADRLGIERAIARDIDKANDAYRRLCEDEAQEWSVEAAMFGEPRRS